MTVTYEIKFCKTPITFFQTRANENIISAKHKKSGYFKISLEKPTINFSLIKERQMNYKREQHAPKTEIKNMHLAKIDHFNKIIFLFPSDSLYKFENLFASSCKLQPSSKKLDFKILSKEELEHRQKNINYMMKKLEIEDEIEMNYIRDEDVFSELGVNDIKTKEDQKVKSGEFRMKRKEYEKLQEDIKSEFIIRRSIFNRRIVNINELNKIFKRPDIVERVVPELCVKIFGRFVLKNKFYDNDIKFLRKQLLTQLSKNGTFLFDETEETKQNLNIRFLLNELCDMEGKGIYKLKGYYEDIKFEKNNVIDIISVIKKYSILSKDALKTILHLEEDEIDTLLNSSNNEKEKIIQLENGTFVVENKSEDKNNKSRSAIIEFFKNNNKVKRNDILSFVHKKTGLELNLITFNRAIKEFCVPKGSLWILKTGAKQ